MCLFQEVRTRPASAGVSHADTWSPWKQQFEIRNDGETMSRPSVVESSFNCQVWWSDERFLVSLVPITSYLVLTNIINVKKDDMVSEPSHIMFLHCNPCHFFPDYGFEF